MISICIPVYNFDINSLLTELTKQAVLSNNPYEIIVIDDCSNLQYQEINKIACKDFTYIELKENIGRAKIRNLFLKYAKCDFLLFIDCDSLIKSSNYLSTYYEIIRHNPEIVCGGRIYDKNPPSRERKLRWKYGIRRESQSYLVRNQFPNRSFMTNNFLINKQIFERVRFDERITQYGHEDTLFGYFLKKENISIMHIDNPVVNGDLETNEEYLEKTKTGIVNLGNILAYTNYDRDLIHNVSILQFYYRVKTFRKIIGYVFIFLRPFIYFMLSKGYVNLYLFDFYKLGLFIQNKSNDKP